METISTASFCFGTFYGFVAAGVIAWVATQIRQERLQTGRKDLALDRFPDSAHPNMTSAGIVDGSNQAALRLVGWSILLIGFIGLSLAGLFYIVA